jgi:2-keto-3-deoxy-6-phosphogluconate aldolase
MPQPLVTALENAGIAAVEVTLRTAGARKVIERMSRIQQRVGAETLTRPEQFSQVREAGSDKPQRANSSTG